MQPTFERLLPRLRRLLALAAGCASLAAALPQPAQAEDVPLSAQELELMAQGQPREQRFVYRSRSREVGARVHDPRSEGFALIVGGEGAGAGATGRIELDPTRWTQLRAEDGEASGWRYLDRSGSRGGVTRAVLRPGRMVVKARGAHWPWAPSQAQDAVWFHALLGDAVYCSRFADDTASDVVENEAGAFVARAADRPEACASQLCGNGELEPGEECDDGNGASGDGCDVSCRLSHCDHVDFENTYDAIQAVIWDEARYACTNPSCHGGSFPLGELDLRAPGSYGELVGVASLFGGLRVAPLSSGSSVLYLKLAARTLGTPIPGLGTPMPVVGDSGIAPEQLEAIRLWIDAGAPRDAVVPETAELLGVCLPAEPSSLR